MAKNDRNLLRDGWTSTLGGVDSGRAPSLLAVNQLAFVTNGTLRGGYCETRPPLISHILTFPSSSVEDWWGAGNILQGARTYYPPEHDAVIAVSVGGRLFTVAPLEDFAIRELTPTLLTTTTIASISPPQGLDVTIDVTSADKMEAGYIAVIGDGDYNIKTILNNSVTFTNLTATPGVSIPSGAIVSWLDRNPKDLPQVWMEQAEEFLIVQDNLDAAILHDGATTRRASPIKDREVPTGSVMVYNEEIGRLCVCTKGNEIAIGDIVGNGTTEVFHFTETTYLSEGGKFRIPRKFGNVTGAAMMTNLDRSNGQGAMLFFAERGISAFNLPPTRELWKSLNYPPQVNMPIRYGAQGQDSIVPVNGDIFYRAKDGIRSFVMAIREFGKWGNVPMSREMQRILKDDAQRLLKFASAVLFDNRLLMTCSPRPYKRSAYYSGLAVLDFDLISSMGESSRPVYDGVWTGLNVLKIVTGEFAGEERCFIFARNNDGGIELWELLKEGYFDGDDGRIEMTVESRSMNSGKQDELKRAAAFEVWVDRVAGEVSLDLEYRSDESPCWADWGSRKVCQTVKDCEAEVCGLPKALKPSYRTRLGFGAPPESCQSSDGKPMPLGYSHQVKLKVTGRARLKMGILKSETVPEPAMAECE